MGVDQGGVLRGEVLAQEDQEVTLQVVQVHGAVGLGEKASLSQFVQRRPDLAGVEPTGCGPEDLDLGDRDGGVLGVRGELLVAGGDRWAQGLHTGEQRSQLAALGVRSECPSPLAEPHDQACPGDAEADLGAGRGEAQRKAVGGLDHLVCLRGQLVQVDDVRVVGQDLAGGVADQRVQLDGGRVHQGQVGGPSGGHEQSTAGPHHVEGRDGVAVPDVVEHEQGLAIGERGSEQASGLVDGEVGSEVGHADGGEERSLQAVQ